LSFATVLIACINGEEDYQLPGLQFELQRIYTPLHCFYNPTSDALFSIATIATNKPL